MCAEFDSLNNEVRKLDEAGADIFHIDIMDGQLVPTFGMGVQDIETIRASTDKPIDVHLMAKEPVRHIKLFADLGVNILYIHPEGDINPLKTLHTIRNSNMKAGLAISPGTSVETVKELLNFVDYVMVITVHPGFAGQDFLPFSADKIETLIGLRKKFHYKILVDGAISPQKIKELGDKGVDGFVLGTSALFNKEESYKNLLEKYKRINFS